MLLVLYANVNHPTLQFLLQLAPVCRRLGTWCQFLKRWITSCVGQSWQLRYCSWCCQW